MLSVVLCSKSPRWADGTSKRMVQYSESLICFRNNFELGHAIMPIC